MTDYSLSADDATDDINGLPSLTRIPKKYTLASTAEQGSETNTLMINKFLTTLADVAFAIASRNLRDKQEGEDQ